MPATTPPGKGKTSSFGSAPALRDSTPEVDSPVDFLEGPRSWTPESAGDLFGDAEEAETTTGLGRSRILRRRAPRRNLAALQAGFWEPSPQKPPRRAPRRNLAALQEEELADVLTEIPKPGESVHLVSNGRWDYWRLVPVCLDLLGRAAEELYGSTWTMSRGNVQELLALLDAGKIRSASILTGTYFLRRESAVAATLQEGLRARGHRYRAFANHTKVVLLAAPPDFLVFEGSANWTANPRLEQNVLVNDEELYRFHRAWMEHFLTRRSS